MYLTAALVPCGAQASSAQAGSAQAGSAQAPTLITAHNFLGWRQKESNGRVCGNGWLSRDSGCGLGNEGKSPAWQVMSRCGHNTHWRACTSLLAGWGCLRIQEHSCGRQTLSHPSQRILSPTHSPCQLPFTSHSGGLCSLGHKRRKWLGHPCPGSKCLRTCGDRVVKVEGWNSGLGLTCSLQEDTQRGRMPSLAPVASRKGYWIHYTERKNEVHKRSKSMDNSVSRLGLECMWVPGFSDRMSPLATRLYPERALTFGKHRCTGRGRAGRQ